MTVGPMTVGPMTVGTVRIGLVWAGVMWAGVMWAGTVWAGVMWAGAVRARALAVAVGPGGPAAPARPGALLLVMIRLVPVHAGLIRAEAAAGRVARSELTSSELTGVELARAELVAAVARASLGATPAAGAGRDGNPDGVLRVLPAAIVLAPAVLVSEIAAGGHGLRVVVFLAPPEPDAQKDGNEDHDDYGDQADDKQDHRTTQQAMAILGGASEATRPWRAGLPQYR